mmetsp:Transcript_24119/g.56267  ORF Transcript_24119/g.56267 Transcript_24119/m.56267 type:complete len:85 (-) Transcript_24119:114-368(-)
MFVLTGKVIAAWPKPNFAPINTRGVEIPNHKTTNPTKVTEGTAYVLPQEFAMWFKMTRKPKAMPGKPNAVNAAARYQQLPLKIL